MFVVVLLDHTIAEAVFQCFRVLDLAVAVALVLAPRCISLSLSHSLSLSVSLSPLTGQTTVSQVFRVFLRCPHVRWSVCGMVWLSRLACLLACVCFTVPCFFGGLSIFGPQHYSIGCLCYVVSVCRCGRRCRVCSLQAHPHRWRKNLFVPTVPTVALLP